MRSFVVASAVLGLVAAAPAPLPTPQDIDFDLAYAVINPTYTVASDATAQTVTYTPSAIFESALPQITSSAANTDVATSTDSANKVKRSDCAPQASGYGPVPSPDTVAAFQTWADFANNATAAPVPSGYTQTFSNLNASNNALGYLGYTTLKSYDVNTCAAKCNAINGCMSVNIYYERDPSVDPGSGTTCSNPSSTTNIKCVFWGGPINPGNANNFGQWRNQFQVVIAGSNGYVNNTIAQVPGYSTAIDLGNAAINAPYDKYGFNSYMGSAIFSNGPFNASLCAQACSTKSAYNLAHPPTDGTPVQTCQFFNTYILYINNTANPNNLQGQYCAMYSESWPSSYATNVGQFRGSDHFLIEYSYAYSNSTNAGSANAVAAEYQAKTDILWPGNSALPYCSSILGYTTPVTTATVTATIVPTVSTVVTSTAQVTTTVVVDVKKRQASSASNSTLLPMTTTGSVIVKNFPTLTSTPAIAARSAVSTPDVLTKYPASIITIGCSLAATPVTSTSTSTVTVTTTGTPAVVTFTADITITQTATSTTTTSQALPTCVGASSNGIRGYSLSAVCDTDVDTNFVFERTNGASTALDCLNAADVDPDALAMTFNTNTKVCNLYVLSSDLDYAYAAGGVSNQGPVATVAKSAGVVFGYYNDLVQYGYISLSD